MPTSVALGPHFENYVREQVKNGRYNNASEVVRAGLRLLEDAQTQYQLKLEALRAEIQAGLDSGPGRDADEFFDELEAKYLAMAEEQERLERKVG
ncbi:MAG: type II toxin-antitoxin system ParD family antitoxin [Pseudoxanthomonas sp.]